VSRTAAREAITQAHHDEWARVVAVARVGRALFGKLLRGAMIIKMQAVFPLVRVEPPVGIEPTTYSLRVNRSAD
jgi:hypothetical protein